MFLKIIIPLLLITLLLTPSAFAQNQQINLGDRQAFGIQAINNPNASPGTIVNNLLLIMYVVGSLAVLIFIVWGALDWITSGGDKEKIAGARKKIMNALIGLALMALAVFIITLFGEIVGLNPLENGSLPRLDSTPTPRTPIAPVTTTP